MTDAATESIYLPGLAVYPFLFLIAIHILAMIGLVVAVCYEIKPWRRWRKRLDAARGKTVHFVKAGGGRGGQQHVCAIVNDFLQGLWPTGTDGGGDDSGAFDSGVVDSGAVDSGAIDSGAVDSGVDGGIVGDAMREARCSARGVEDVDDGVCVAPGVDNHDAAHKAEKNDERCGDDRVERTGALGIGGICMSGVGALDADANMIASMIATSDDGPPPLAQGKSWRSSGVLRSRTGTPLPGADGVEYE